MCFLVDSTAFFADECVCACGSVRILERKKFAVAQADTPFEEESGLQC